jgi:hypothetical protein
MLRWSIQHKIVSDFSLSFSQHEKLYTAVSQKILERDKMFLKPKKYESYSEADFKFIVLYTLLHFCTNKIDTLKILNKLQPEELEQIRKFKEKIIMFQNTLEQDLSVSRTKINTPSSVYKMYKQGTYSLLYFYVYYKQLDLQNAGRLQRRAFERVSFFLSYFPKIKQFLDDFKVN